MIFVLADQEKNIRNVVEKYRAAGGTAILHHDVDVTIRELSRLYLEWQGGE